MQPVRGRSRPRSFGDLDEIVSIKTLILERFSRRADSSAPTLPPEGQRKALRGIVQDTILPRRIIVSGAAKSLSLDVAESRVFALSCQIDGRDMLAIDFAQTPLSTALKTEISEALDSFLTPAEAFSIEYGAFTRPDEKGHALRADTLFTPPRSPAPPEVESPAPQIVASAPSQRFLQKAAPDLQDSRSFAFGGTDVPMEALHKKLSAALDGPLLCVAMADNPAQDTYAFALDETGGVVAKLHRQKLGKLCVAWNKTLQAPE